MLYTLAKGLDARLTMIGLKTAMTWVPERVQYRAVVTDWDGIEHEAYDWSPLAALEKAYALTMPVRTTG